MAIAETAKLIASLELKDLFTKQVDSATKSLGKLDKSLDSTQSRAYKAGSQIGTGIRRGVAIAVAGLGLVATQVALGVKSLEDLEKVTTQTNAVLKSTKDVSGQTAAGIRDMANGFENLNATMDDTTIQAGANVLLTFTNIREKAFKPTLQAALDLSTAMGQDLQSSVVQIGKALSDPIKGLTSLTRVGVTFTAAQKDQIKQLVKSNDLYGAQKVILGELNKEFGGSFLAQGNTTAGKIAKVKDAIDDLQRALATALLPALGKIADATSKFLTRPEVIKAVSDLGQQIAGLFSDENLAKGADVLKGFFQTAKDLAPVIEASAKATLTLVEAAVSLFKSLPPGLQDIAVGAFAINKLTGGLVTNVAGGIAGAVVNLVKSTRGASPVNPVFVSDVSKGLPIPGVPGGGGLPVTPIVGETGGLAGFLQKLPLIGAAFAISASLAPTQAAADQRLHDLVASFPGQSASKPSYVQSTGSLPNPLLDRGGRESGVAGSLQGKIHDDLLTLGQLMKGIWADIRGNLNTLEKSNDPKAIANAVKGIERALITNQHGSVQTTKTAIADLKKALTKTHDPALQASIRTTIDHLEHVLPYRELQQKDFAQATKILSSTKTTGDKIRELQGIEKDLKDHKLPGAAKVIAARIDALNHVISPELQAIKDKDSSIKITNILPSIKVAVDSRQVASTQVSYSRIYRTPV